MKFYCVNEYKELNLFSQKQLGWRFRCENKVENSSCCADSLSGASSAKSNATKVSKWKLSRSFSPRGLRVCLVTVFPLIFCFQKQFSIFKTKKLVRQPKMDRKQKLFSKLNLWRKLKICKRLFPVSSFQKLMKTRIWLNESISFNELALEFKS